MRRPLTAALFVVASLGCGSASSNVPAGDGGAGDGGSDVAVDLPPSGRAGRVRVTVTYGGRVMPGAQLQLSASRMMTPGGAPDSFAVVKDPTFPATGELVFGEAGSFFIFANLNATPVKVTPGPEDRVARSPMAVDVQLGVVREISLELLDRDG